MDELDVTSAESKAIYVRVKQIGHTNLQHRFILIGVGDEQCHTQMKKRSVMLGNGLKAA